MSTATILQPPTAPRRRAAVVVTSDHWEPQLLAAVFQRGRIVIETFAAGRLMYCWPVNEFQAVAPQEGARVWCLFDPITAEEIMVFSAPTGHEEPVFLGVAEVDFADDEEVES
jgi:hypothetical protein